MSDNKCDCNQQNEVRDLTKVASALPEGALLQSQAQAFTFHPDTLAAQISACVSSSYDSGKVCVNFPIIGNICFSVSLPIPSGSSIKVCMETCGFRIGIPPFKGIKATVSFNGQSLWTGVIWGNC
jgi:hypothetical protein